MVLKRVGVWSVARIFAALYGGLGLLIGICIALVSTVAGGLFAAANQGNGMPGWIGPIFGVGAVFILPIFYGVLGLVGGAIWGALYNLFAKLVGGIELQLE